MTAPDSAAMKPSRLLPCPMYAKPVNGPILVTWKGDYGVWSAQVHCLDCRLTIERSSLRSESDAEAAMLKHWNTRAIPASPAEKASTPSPARGAEVTSKAKAPEVKRDDNRCARCGWPLASTAALGCVRGNCSYRPEPPLARHQFYDAERWDREVCEATGTGARP